MVHRPPLCSHIPVCTQQPLLRIWPQRSGPDRREITPKLEVHATADLIPMAVEMHRAQGPRSLASAVLQDCRSSSGADIGGPSFRPLAQ